ncbi:MAG TPA: acyltransferase [Candidatus Acidoferrales bacterium]|nr:acyltransferase [Candidatus Acidoferrales bacterium]
MDLPKHIPQLDVLRGIAVLTVIGYHGLHLIPHLHLNVVLGTGYVGVDLFFVLSGFLITGILVRTKDSPNYFRNFYARRALRIWPVYYLLLLFTFIALPLIHPQSTAVIFAKSHPWESYPFFLQNFAVTGNSFGTLTATWSLAIEEQFYLVWPLVIFLAPPRLLKPIAVGALFLSVAARWSVQYGLIPSVIIYTNTLTRLDGLALGALLALWIPQARKTTVRLVAMIGLLLTTPIALALGYMHPGHWSFFAVVSACFACLLLLAIQIDVLSKLRFLRYTGKISYCLYLVHVPVFMLAEMSTVRRLAPFRPGTAGDAILFLASILVCYGIAAASWTFLESKFLRLKDRFNYTASFSSPTRSGRILVS